MQNGWCPAAFGEVWACDRWLWSPGSNVSSDPAGIQFILRKEVIQPQVPLRLPCYDLVPITELVLGACVP
jgi:hypothetical protein